MKKYFCVFLIITICCTLFSCNNAKDNMTEEEFFDLSKKHKPTEEDIIKFNNLTGVADIINKIKTATDSDDAQKYIEELEHNTESVLLKDAIRILGKPHKFGPETGATTLIWETTEGNTYKCTVSFNINDEASFSSVYRRLYETGNIYYLYRINEGSLYKTYEDPELSDLFVSATDKGALLNEEDFLDKTKSSSYIQYGDVMPYDKFIELVGKPQREVVYIGPSPTGYQSSEPFPKVRNFEWALKDNKTIIYTVVLSDECQDGSANSDNVMKFGLVGNISSNKAVE